MASKSIVQSSNSTYIVIRRGLHIMTEVVTRDWILKLGESFLGSKSSKQCVGSPSSTDTEIIAIADGFKNLKWLDNLTCEIGLPLTICHLYQDNLSASKIMMKSTKTKQVKHLLSKINLAQQYFADKLYVIIQGA